MQGCAYLLTEAAQKPSSDTLSLYAWAAGSIPQMSTLMSPMLHSPLLLPFILPPRRGVQLTSLECGQACNPRVTRRMQQKWHCVNSEAASGRSMQLPPCVPAMPALQKATCHGSSLATPESPCVGDWSGCKQPLQSPKSHHSFVWSHLGLSRHLYSLAKKHCLKSLKLHGTDK